MRIMPTSMHDAICFTLEVGFDLLLHNGSARDEDRHINQSTVIGCMWRLTCMGNASMSARSANVGCPVPIVPTTPDFATGCLKGIYICVR